MSKLKESKYLRCFILGIIFVFIAVLFLLVGSVSTSPFISRGFTDSSIFQTIGKGWANGLVPYSQLWDLKGPYIFFVNAIGYVFTENSTGLFIVQIFNFIFIEIAIYNIFRLKLNRPVSFLLLLACLSYLFFNYDAGNSVEEFCLPFILFCVFFQLKWLFNLKNNCSHKPIIALLYGITLTVCLMTRATNFIGIGVGIIYIAIFLLVKSQYKNLFKNILLFFIGFILTAFPFIIYFIYNDSFFDFLYGTFIYNIGYSGSLKFTLRPRNLGQTCSLVGGWATSIYFIIKIFISKNKHERLFAIFWTLCSLMMFVVVLKCLDYKHYAILLLPYYIVALLDISFVIKSNKQNKKLKACLIFVMAGFIVLGAMGVPKSAYNCVKVYKKNMNLSQSNISDELAEPRKLFNEIPLEERDSFIAYNCSSGIYLGFDILPCYKFFVLQSFEVSQNENLRPYIIDEFNKLDAKWILVNKFYGSQEIQDIIDNNYRAYSDNNDYCLYRKMV